MSTNSRARIQLLERLLENSGRFEVSSVATSDGGRSVVAYDPKLQRAYVFVDGTTHTIVDHELQGELRWAQHLAEAIPQDGLPSFAGDAISDPGTRGQYSHLSLEAAITFGWDSPHGGPARRLLTEVVFDKNTGTIIDWGVSPGKAGKRALQADSGDLSGPRRSIDLVALREGITVSDIVKRETRIQDVIAASIDYKTGGARLEGVKELRELTGAPVVRLARGGQLDQQLAGAVNLIAPPTELAGSGPAPDVLARHPDLSPAANAALLDGHVQYAVSNAHAGKVNAAFSSAIFSRGYVAFDIVSGGFLSSVHELNHARRDFAVRGQRGFATVGGMVLSLVSIGGLVFAVKEMKDFDDVVEFAVDNVATGVGGLLIGRLVGSAAVGAVGGFLLSMDNDQGPPSEEEVRQERVTAFLERNFSQPEIEAGGKDLRGEAYAFLFETIPMILAQGPTSDGSSVGNLTMRLIDQLDALADSDAPIKPPLVAVIYILKRGGGEQMREMLQQKWYVGGGTYYDHLLDWLESENLHGLVKHLPAPEIDEGPRPDLPPTHNEQTFNVPTVPRVVGVLVDSDNDGVPDKSVPIDSPAAQAALKEVIPDTGSPAPAETKQDTTPPQPAESKEDASSPPPAESKGQPGAEAEGSFRMEADAAASAVEGAPDFDQSFDMRTDIKRVTEDAALLAAESSGQPGAAGPQGQFIPVLLPLPDDPPGGGGYLAAARRGVMDMSVPTDQSDGGASALDLALPLPDMTMPVHHEVAWGGARDADGGSAPVRELAMPLPDDVMGGREVGADRGGTSTPVMSTPDNLAEDDDGGGAPAPDLAAPLPDMAMPLHHHFAEGADGGGAPAPDQAPSPPDMLLPPPDMLLPPLHHDMSMPLPDDLAWGGIGDADRDMGSAPDISVPLPDDRVLYDDYGEGSDDLSLPLPDSVEWGGQSDADRDNEPDDSVPIGVPDEPVVDVEPVVDIEPVVDVAPNIFDRPGPG
jgi:hypothetical protein